MIFDWIFFFMAYTWWVLDIPGVYGDIPGIYGDISRWLSWRFNPLRNGYLGADRSALLEFWSPFPARERLVESQPAQELDISILMGRGGGSVFWHTPKMSVFF